MNEYNFCNDDFEIINKEINKYCDIKKYIDWIFSIKPVELYFDYEVEHGYMIIEDDRNSIKL
jgi:hypothetical protein